MLANAMRGRFEIYESWEPARGSGRGSLAQVFTDCQQRTRR